MAKKKRGSTPRVQKNTKPPKKEPFHMPKWGWIAIISVLALIVLGFIGYRVYYSLSALPVNSDGAVVTKGENVLFFNVGTTDKPRYLRYGVIEAPAGYTLEGDNAVRSNDDKAYVFLPEAEDAPVDRYVATVANGTNDAIVESTREYIAGSFSDGTSTDVVHTEIAGHDVYYYTYMMQNTDTSTGDLLSVKRTINAYAKADDPYSILVSATLPESRGDEPLSEEEIAQLLTPALEGLTVP